MIANYFSRWRGFRREELAVGGTPVDWLAYWAMRKPDSVFLVSLEGTGRRQITWRQALAKVRALASHLRFLGVRPGARVGIWAKNCPEWILADLAIWTVGAVSVPIYPSVSPSVLDEILERADVRYLFADYPSALAKNIRSNGLTAFPLEVPLEDAAQEPIEAWDWDLDSVATINYTSGTTQQARGVMHSLAQITAATGGIIHERPLHPTRYLAYTSLANVGERLITEMLPLLLGGTTYFNRNIASLVSDLRVARPTSFVGVPRVWNQFKKALDREIPEAKLGSLLALPLIGRLVKRKIKRKLGLDRAMAAITGSTPSDVQVLRYFQALGIPIREVYALTENFGYSHRNYPQRTRLGSVGHPLPGVQVKLDIDGEVLVASPANMIGYCDEAAATASAFDGKYLRTGDLGRVDEDGYLWITGRKKDLFKTAAGHTIHPELVEAVLEAHELVDRALVAGNGLQGPLALVQLNAEKRNNLSPQALHRELEVLRTRANNRFDSHQGIRKIVVTKEAWAADPRFLTPTQKIRRHELEKQYEPFFSQWMAFPKTVLQV